jgi:hypothetical protein
MKADVEGGGPLQSGLVEPCRPVSERPNGSLGAPVSPNHRIIRAE